MQALRIITINTGKCDGPYRQRLDYLAQELEALQPDIVVMQECFRGEDGELDTASSLARRLKLQLAWTEARFKTREVEGHDVAGWSGMAMLTRQPFAMVDNLDLPADPRDGDRRAQVGLLELDDAMVVVANLHLTHLRGEDGLRSQQLRRVLSHPLLGMKRALRVVCGDFNTTIDGPVLAPVLAEWGSGHLVDAYTLGKGAPERATLPRGYCVDYILSLAEDEFTHPIFTSSSVVLNRPEPATGILPSDHYGVATTMLTGPIRSRLDRKRTAVVS